MSSQEPPNADYFFGFKPNESVVKSHMVRTAENQCQYMLPTLQRMVAAKPNLKLWDVGCGPGSITTSLARYLPNGDLVGVDKSEDVLEKARQLAKEEQLHNLTFQSADVYALPFDDETFDVVHTHQAVVHFHQHVKAIRELLRVLKTCGVLCMHCIRVAIAMHEKQGASPDAGRKLKAWAVEAGIPRDNIVFTGGVGCHHTPDQRRNFNGPNLFKDPVGQKAIDLGVATRERIREFDQAWKRWTEDDDALLMIMHREVIAQD